jgi:hypothetical protein
MLAKEPGLVPSHLLWFSVWMARVQTTVARDLPTELDLFLCHNGADAAWTRDLATRLGREMVGQRPLRVFFAPTSIAPGENFVVSLDDALSRARFVGLVLSPELVDSDWCRAEIASVLATDPLNRHGRLIPLHMRDAHKTTRARLEVPPLLRAINKLDFRTDRDARRSYERLVARVKGEPARGAASRPAPASQAFVPALPERREDPDFIQETVLSNLLPVLEWPRFLWRAPTSLRRREELRDRADMAGVRLPPFTLKEDSLLTFEDLEKADSPFRPLLTGLPRRVTVVDFRSDDSRWRWVIELFNLALRQHLYPAIRYDRDHRRFVFTPVPGPPTKRILLGRTAVRPPPEGGGYWVHQAARLRFETLGRKVFLAIDPSWTFTTDGRQAVPSKTAGPLAMKWGGLERNGSILRHILFWSDVLAGSRRNAAIRAGEGQIVIRRMPSTVLATAGIYDDRVKVRALMQISAAEQNLELDEGLEHEDAPDDDERHAAEEPAE